MNLGQIKDKTVHIVREYSNNGDKIGTGENADYLNSIGSFVSDSQMEIIKKRPIIRDIQLVNPKKESGRYYKYEKPKQFYKIIDIKLDDCIFIDYEENYKEIWIPKRYTGEFIMTYEKIPAIITSSTPDSTELEIDEDLQYITAYKAAAGIIIDESPDMSATIRAEYEKLLYGIESKDLNKSLYIHTIYGV